MVAQERCPEEKFLHLSSRDLTAVVVLLLLFVTTGLAYRHYTPLWSPPDEERHFAYAQYVARNHKLPPLRYDTETTNVTQAIHPPLYYLLASLFCGDGEEPIQERLLVNDGPGFTPFSLPPGERGSPPAGAALTAQRLRLFSLVVSAVHLVFLYLLVSAIFPGATILAFATALFVATNPQFIHISASVSNEPLADALSTVYLFTLVYAARGTAGARHHLLTGAVLGCCLLSKLSTIYYLPLTAGMLVCIYFRNRRKLIASLALVMGAASLVAGWWYLRNWLIFDDPFATRYLIASQPWGFRKTPLSPGYLLTLAANTFLSFFGNFGALQFSIHRGHAFTYALIVLLGLAGLCRLVISGTIKREQRQAFAILLLSFLGCCALFVSMNISYVGVSMGRYLFVAIAPIAAGIGAGVWSLFPPRRKNGFLILLSVLLLGLTLDVLFRVVKPAYTETLLIAGTDQPLFSHPTVAISASSDLAQTFTAAHNNLSAVRIMFSSPAKPRRGELAFSLLEEGTRRVIRRACLPLRKIEDNVRYFFVFPPVRDSAGKTYLLRMSASGTSADSSISLWQEPGNPYPGGELLVNARPAAGDAYFSTYYFTGTHPSTDWQGRRELVIRQGAYVDVRELQLYLEQSRVFREGTITHQKILRAQQALKNREVLLQKDNHA